MKKIVILSAVGLTLAGAALASDDRSERRHYGERGEHSRSHDESTEHANRRVKRRHHDEHGSHHRDRQHDDDQGNRDHDRKGKRS